MGVTVCAPSVLLSSPLISSFEKICIMSVSLSSFAPTQKRDSVRSYRKENKFHSGVYALARRNGRLVSVVDARFYWPGESCYSVVWVCSGTGRTVFGCGRAGGYGYEKKSAALSAALSDCGVEVDGLCGTGLVSNAVELLGRHICELYDYEFLGVFEAFG